MGTRIRIYYGEICQILGHIFLVSITESFVQRVPFVQPGLFVIRRLFEQADDQEAPRLDVSVWILLLSCLLWSHLAPRAVAV